MNNLINLYLSYLNDFLTIAKFAEHYELDDKDAEILILMGKKYHERLR